MAASVSRSRLLEFTKVCPNPNPPTAHPHPLLNSDLPTNILLTFLQLQCSLFSATFNPSRQRLGNKVLRQRLKGPTIAAYYPRKSSTVDTMLHTFKKRFGLDGWNDFQEDRLEGLEIAKMRGKGAPKKIRTKDEAGSGKKKKKR
jgi:small subunit ribosomal protein S33